MNSFHKSVAVGVSPFEGWGVFLFLNIEEVLTN